MNKTVSIAILVVGVSGAAAMPAHADATRTNYQFRGERAEAELTWTEDDGCTQGWLYVAGGESVTHEAGGSPVTSTLAYAWYSTYNYCTGGHQRARGAIDGGAVIDAMESATLSIPMIILRPECNEEGRCDEVPTGEVAMLEVTLTGEGAATRGITMTTSSGDGYRSVAHEVGITREAMAVGSLVFGGFDHLEGAMVTRASIGSSDSSTHSFYRW
jgi:hypothetical protein